MSARDRDAPRPPRARRPAPQRYQLGKRALAVLASGHPWIFRGLVSSAADALADGQWLALVDGANQTVGHGIYAAEGAIAIRVVARGPVRPRGADFTARIDRALTARAGLRRETDGFRAVHGENDDLPGVTVDVYGTTVVAQAYAAGTDALARLAGRRVAAATGASALVLRTGHRRVGAAPPSGPRVVRGAAPDVAPFREGPFTFAARPVSGQKGGTFLDLRNLRRWLAAAPLAGARVLNLFAYTGTLGAAAAHAGAAHVTHVDRAADALAFARAHHATGDRHAFVTADVFDWLKRPAGAAHDLVIVDPPSMTSRADQVPGVLATYRRLQAAAARQVAPGGLLVLACCTSRVARGAFREVARASTQGFTPVADLPPEVDHPVRFPEADYLKILIFRAPPRPAP